MRGGIRAGVAIALVVHAVATRAVGQEAPVGTLEVYDALPAASSLDVAPGQRTQFSVWVAGEDLRYVWLLDGGPVGDRHAWTFAPEGRDVGPHRVTVAVDGGAGRVQRTWIVNVTAGGRGTSPAPSLGTTSIVPTAAPPTTGLPPIVSTTAPPMPTPPVVATAAAPTTTAPVVTTTEAPATTLLATTSTTTTTAQRATTTRPRPKHRKRRRRPVVEENEEEPPVPARPPPEPPQAPEPVPLGTLP